MIERSLEEPNAYRRYLYSAKKFLRLTGQWFSKTGLITKGIYEVEQVFKTIENLPDDQEHLIRYEIRQFLMTLEQVQEGYRINFSNEETRILENLREVVCPI